MRVILYFGSFNPVHKGHIAIAEYLIKEKRCDELWFVVSPHNPLKKEQDLAPFSHRSAMTRLTVESSACAAQMTVTDIENELPKPSYTIRTLGLLRDLYPSCEFSMVMGSDNLTEIEKWKDYPQIFETTKVFVYPREGYAASFSHRNIAFLKDAPTFDINSTSLREQLKNAEDVSDLLPAGVYDYIKFHHLYGV